VSWRRYCALTTAFLRIAWRGPAATDGGKRWRGGILFGFLGYLVLGGFLMFPAFLVPDPRVAGFLIQSVGFMMVGLSFLSIYGDLVFDARDVPLLFWRPLDPRAYLAARLTAILFYFVGVAAALNLPGALVLALRFGPAWYPLAHLVGACVGALAGLILALLLVFTLLRAVGREKVRDTVAWIQIVVAFLFVAGNQFLSQLDLLGRLRVAGILAGDVAWFLPMAWAQAVADVLALRALPGQPGVAVSGTAISLGLAAILVAIFARTYGRILQSFAEGEARREAPVSASRVRRALERATKGDHDARAGFLLAWATIRRARDYKVRAIPQFGLPLIFLCMAVLRDAQPMAAMAPPMLALAACNGLVGLVGSAHAEAAWVWRLSPYATPVTVARGASLAILGALVTPVLLLVGLLAALAWGPVRAVGFTSLAAGLSMASLRWMLRLVDRFPCTASLEEARRHALGLKVIAILVFGVFIVSIDAVLYRETGAWGSLVLAAPLLVWGWRGLVLRR